ncbi:hypothetical protein M426DRAFT_16233 [Hypoxylon sp. CI-4A]|nr:hypothetical protein M426DRAFT_16233 [Hypoxylon sp. CI-4A]
MDLYERRAKFSGYLFSRYRSHGESLFSNLLGRWNNPTHPYRNYQIPPEEPENPDEREFSQIDYGIQRVDEARTYSQGEGVFDLDGPPIPPEMNLRASTARGELRDFKEFFFDAPRYNYIKCLGYGSFGIAAVFRDGDSKYVVKFPAKGDQAISDGLQEEALKTKKVRRSAHCIQVVDPEKIGQESRDYIAPLSDTDSSEDWDSSGDESATDDRLEVLAGDFMKTLRENRRTTELKKVQAALDKETRQAFIGQNNQKLPLDDWTDFIILEYLESGDLKSLIYKLASRGRMRMGLRVHIPNRILWSFWLCLVRGCIAMEYPPRKFSRDRKRPAQDLSEHPASRKRRGADGQVVYDNGIERFLQERFDNLENDLIEEIPNKKNRVRKMNMVHFDIDPTNILIGGLELNQAGLDTWQRTQDDAQEKENHVAREIDHVKPRLDRVKGEHELVPRLKIADFGNARIIKKNKRNEYYVAKRQDGKMGWLAPEQFSKEWDHIPPRADGSEVAALNDLGNYGPHTNIWGIAQVMWCLITQLNPPLPPQPQVPEEIRVIMQDDIDKHQGRIWEEIRDLEDHNLHNFLENYAVVRLKDLMRVYYDRFYQLYPNDPEPPVSYCSRIYPMEYRYVDKDLRKTIWSCMYHRPKDRPTLLELLEQAKDKTRIMNPHFPDEPDEYVRKWIYKWIYQVPPDGVNESEDSDDNPDEDEDEDENEDESEDGGGGGGGGAVGGAVGGGGGGGGDDPAAQFARDFPNQYRRALDAGGRPGSRSGGTGLNALGHSITSQLNDPNHAVDYRGLLEIFQTMLNNGVFDGPDGRPVYDIRREGLGPSDERRIEMVMQEWARQHNLSLRLGIAVSLPDGTLGNFRFEGAAADPNNANLRTIWIVSQPGDLNLWVGLMH